MIWEHASPPDVRVVAGEEKRAGRADCGPILLNVHAVKIPHGAVVKNLTAMQETQVQSLGLEDPLEKGTPPGEGNGHPLQYSYLDNSMDRGTWLQSMGLTQSWA